MLPDLNGMEVTRRIVHASPHTRVAVLSMSADERHVVEALRRRRYGLHHRRADAAMIRFALAEGDDGRRCVWSTL